jgi:hypothetical protein
VTYVNEKMTSGPRHCEEQSDEAIQLPGRDSAA